MKKTNKKLIIFVMAAVIIGAFMMVCKGKDGQTNYQILSESNSAAINTEGLLNKPPEQLDTGRIFIKMVFALVIVVALGVGAIYLSKKLVPRITSSSSKEVQIIETVHIGPHRAVHLLKVGSRRILIGSTNENITRLADIPDTDADSYEQGTINKR